MEFGSVELKFEIHQILKIELGENRFDSTTNNDLSIKSTIEISYIQFNKEVYTLQ